MLLSPIHLFADDIYLDRLVDSYANYRAAFDQPPGFFQPQIERAIFARFLLNTTPVQNERVLLTPESIHLVVRRLRERGYSLSETPLSTTEVSHILEARRLLHWSFPQNRDVLTGLDAEWTATLQRERQAVPIPATGIILRPQLESYHLPNSIPLLNLQGGDLEVNLHQVSGGFGRLRRLFEVLASTRVGMSVLQEALPLIQRRELEIREFTDQVRADHDAFNAAAMFVYEQRLNGFSRVVYIDPNQETGILALSLLHELSHALDENYLAARRNAFTLADRIQELRQRAPQSEELVRVRAEFERMIRRAQRTTEVIAWTNEGLFMQQLGQRFPQTNVYYRAHGQRDGIVSWLFPVDALIERRYGAGYAYGASSRRGPCDFLRFFSERSLL